MVDDVQPSQMAYLIQAIEAASLITNKTCHFGVVSRSISPQRSQSTQRIFNFFLGVLCDLRGELLCFFFD